MTQNDWKNIPVLPLGVLLLGILLLGLFVRSPSTSFPGFFDPDSHFHTRMAEHVVQYSEVPQWDSLSMQGRQYSYPPLLHVTVGLFASFLNIDTLLAHKLFGILIGALFGITTYLFANALLKSRPMALWSALFATLSGIAIIRTSGFTRPDGFALTLIPFVLYLWLTRKEWLALLVCVAMVFLHPLSAVFMGVILGVWFIASLFKQARFTILMPIAMGLMITAFFVWVYVIMGYTIGDYASGVSLEASELAKFTLLGFITYFPLSWAFSLVGILRGKIPVLLGAWIAITVLMGAMGLRLSMYMIPFLAVAGAIGLYWVVEKLKRVKLAFPVMLVLLIVLGCVTSWYFMQGIHPYANNSQLASMEFLDSYADDSESILNLWDQGHVLAYYTNQPVVIDGYFEFAPKDLETRNETSRAAIITSHCDKWIDAMSKYDATYLFLSPDETTSINVENGILELEPCPESRILYASTGNRIFEKIE